MTDEETRAYDDNPGLTVQTAYFEGQRDAYFCLSRMLTKREMYETTDATFPELDDRAIAAGYVDLPIPSPQ